MTKAAIWLFAAAVGIAVVVMAAPKRERVGNVYDKPIYRDELGADEHGLPGEDLRRLILPPLIKKIREKHRKEIKPTREELAVAQKYFSKELPGLADDFSDWFIENWKTERYLYLNYGGGRLLWQQTGLEAFDATYRWLQEEERSGHFVISDKQLRTDFYHYWTDMKHGAFLTDDKSRIEDEFLFPEWVRGKNHVNPEE
ncbi:MAG: hypothetical protein ACR2PT_04080 [Endozoicomonas sp.]